MKRFIADAILVFICISIGSYLMDQDTLESHEQLALEKEKFEENIALHNDLAYQHQKVALNDVEENKAGQLAKASSEAVIQVLHGSVRLFSSLFSAVTK